MVARARAAKGEVGEREYSKRRRERVLKEQEVTFFELFLATFEFHPIGRPRRDPRDVICGDGRSSKYFVASQSIFDRRP